MPDEEGRSAAGSDPRARDAAPAPGQLADNPRAVLALLEPDQIVSAKQRPFGARALSPGLRMLLWSLRVYVVFMLAVVVVAVVRSLRGG